jgi:hypothetical protein
MRPSATTTGPPAERLRLSGGINAVVTHDRSGWAWRPAVTATAFGVFPSKKAALTHAGWLIRTLGYAGRGSATSPPTTAAPTNPGG